MDGPDWSLRREESPSVASQWQPVFTLQASAGTKEHQKKSLKDIKINLTFYVLIIVTLKLQRFRFPSNQNNLGCYSWSALFL